MLLVKRAIKGTQSPIGPHWPGHYFSQFEKDLITSTQNQMYTSDTSRNPLSSGLVFHSILYFFSENLFLTQQTFMHPKTLFYHNYLVKHSIQRNIKRGGGKRVGAGREKSPSCRRKQAKWINNTAEQIVITNIWKIDGERYNQAVSTYWFVKFRSIRQCLAFPGQVHWWILDGI